MCRFREGRGKRAYNCRKLVTLRVSIWRASPADPMRNTAHRPVDYEFYKRWRQIIRLKRHSNELRQAVNEDRCWQDSHHSFCPLSNKCNHFKRTSVNFAHGSSHGKTYVCLDPVSPSVIWQAKFQYTTVKTVARGTPFGHRRVQRAKQYLGRK